MSAQLNCGPSYHQAQPAAQSAVSTSRDYRDRERKADRLPHQGFQVEPISILGMGLRYVEQVAGRVTTTRTAPLGARAGAKRYWIIGRGPPVLTRHDSAIDRKEVKDAQGVHHRPRPSTRPPAASVSSAFPRSSTAARPSRLARDSPALRDHHRKLDMNDLSKQKEHREEIVVALTACAIGAGVTVPSAVAEPTGGPASRPARRRSFPTPYRSVAAGARRPSSSATTPGPSRMPSVPCRRSAPVNRGSRARPGGRCEPAARIEAGQEA